MCFRLEEARNVLTGAHEQWPSDSLCQGYLGLTLKLQGHIDLAIPLLSTSVQSGAANSHFYFHLGDALQRKNQNEKAMQVSFLVKLKYLPKEFPVIVYYFFNKIN